jgi:hypothetical protein
MDKDKSILERFTDTVKDIANSASEALKAEEPPKVEQSNAAYMPFAAEGLVSDPLLIPPVAALPPRRKRTARRTAKTSATKSSARKATAKRVAPKKAKKAAKTSARGKSRASSRSAAKASARRTAKRPAKKRTAKRPSGKRTR